MATRSGSCSAGTCDDQRTDHDRGGRHRRARVPGPRRGRRAEGAALRRRVARHAAWARGAARAAAWHRHRVDHDRRRARSRRLGLGQRTVPARGGSRRSAAGVSSAPARGRARHGGVRGRTRRARGVARAQAAADSRAELRRGDHESLARAAREPRVRGVPGHLPAARPRRADRQSPAPLAGRARRRRAQGSRPGGRRGAGCS